MLEAVGNFPIMIDSGVRRGTDVIKAISLGARAVFIGRPFNYAASVAGREGIDHAIGLVIEEVRRDLGMLGVVSVYGLNRGYLREVRALS